MSLQRLPACAGLINARHKNYSLVDLGCRNMALKALLENCSGYLGADFVEGPDVVQCNLEDGLPSFETNSHDIVVALDVLEHLENCHKLLQEMLRVARKSVYVSLPNMFYVSFRLNVLLKGELSGKYNFHTDPVVDRHRWLLSYNEAVRFIEANAQGYTVNHHKIIPQRGRTRLLLGGVEKVLGEMFPNLFSYGSLHEIRIDGT
ncbi:Methionine biosynthesis protein MetW [SAR116 cluster alpha proteobacterium HIMB100]|nr:Methionine biosynthesis protein MetW [SAR116 cluster alpha proteobacterium HIMB100]